MGVTGDIHASHLSWQSFSYLVLVFRIYFFLHFNRLESNE